PSLVAETLGGDAQTLGLLLASAGAGALIGVTIFAPLAQSFKRTGVVMALGVMWAGFWWIMVSRSQSAPLSMLFICLVSWGVPAVLTTANGLLQTMAPPAMRGRLLATFIIVSFGIQPISSLVIGFVADRVGTPNAMLISGAALIISALLMLALRPGLRFWEAPRASEPAVVHESH
ncbi:MAG: MFS transporter, partial [Chloroflexi bacterium]|nr:MFS transporter [Chloroflexota bacterium]